MELIIGVVGKPSVGKSTFFNALTEGKAKIGNYPFTTIEPNTGVTYYATECACKSRNLAHACRPRYGRCENGTRYIPVKLLDVAGLVPGASQGAGLGNRFLDDLRHAHSLVHILDVSGTTNEKGETCQGYDPLNDADWLQSEIHAWVFNNLWSRWPNIARRHNATRSNLAATLQSQLSGYGAKMSTCLRVIDELAHKISDPTRARDPVDLTQWTEEDVHTLVEVFLDVRFPTILLLNKADQGGDSDRNIERIVNKYDASRCFVASAAAELFLKQASRKKFILYKPGDSTFLSKADVADEIEFCRMRGEEVNPELLAAAETLVEPEQLVRKRLERIKDMVLFRHGSTGVWNAIQAAVNLHQPSIVYPVRSLRSYTTDPEGTEVFGNVYMLRPGTTVGELAEIVLPHTEIFQHCEAEDGRRMAEDTVLQGQGLVVRLVARPREDLGERKQAAGSEARAGGAKPAAGGQSESKS